MLNEGFCFEANCASFASSTLWVGTAGIVWNTVQASDALSAMSVVLCLFHEWSD